MAGKIFINYRRDDSISTAGRLHDRLAQTFGRKNLFMDVDHVPAGVDFVDYLHSQVAACDVFLSIIGPNWVDAKDDDGHPRFDNPNDFVAIEIAAALARNIRVIPVLVDGARTPKADKLPESIKSLVRRNAVEVRNTHFGRDAEALIEKIGEALSDKPLKINQWRVAAAAAAVLTLLLVGWIGVFATGIPRWWTWVIHPDTRAQAEKERSTTIQANDEPAGKPATEAEAKPKLPPFLKPIAEPDRQEVPSNAGQDRYAWVRKSEEDKRTAALNPEHADGNGWLGVRTRPVTNDVAERLNIKPPRGSFVANVNRDSPAKWVGIERGDVILKIDGKDINGSGDVRRVMADIPVDKQVPVVFIRHGEEMTKRVTVGRIPEAEVLVRQGDTALHEGDYERAIAAYSEAIKRNPTSASAFNGRGIAYARRGDLNRAISEYTQAIRIDPNYEMAFCNRGNAKLKIKDASGNPDIEKARQLDASVCRTTRTLGPEGELDTVAR